MGKAYAGPQPAFPVAAKEALQDEQLRGNLGRVTSTIRAKRESVVAERSDWGALRSAGRRAKDEALDDLAPLLVAFEERATAAGATVHWARDGDEAAGIVLDVARRHGIESVVKVKSLTTDEIGLNEALTGAGVAAKETDLAELIIQLAGEHPSHILVPAIHKNREQIRELFVRTLDEAEDDISSDPADLAASARTHLRSRFLEARMAVSGANFAIAETGSLVVVESEGNGRMCLTLPDVLVSIVGIEKVLPRWDDLETVMQLLPRSSTGERMNPYTSIWTGVAPGDGPQEVHIVLLDNGRTSALADPVGRDALTCIRCSACLNVCPVYERTGGHAYGSVYPGPIGAVITPQLLEPGAAASLPFASTLCGACYDVCPMKIDIPSILVHLRATQPHGAGERAAFSAAAAALSDGRRVRAVASVGWILRPFAALANAVSLPVARKWTVSRSAPRPARQSFRSWWRKHERG
jgi:L-lactate dehydrogenase complex protein LldF